MTSPATVCSFAVRNADAVAQVGSLQSFQCDVSVS